MSKNYVKKIIFNGGVSTEPEVNDLMEKIGVPAAGQQISYAQVEEISSTKRGTGRWDSVTNAWRTRLRRQYNVELLAIRNEGFQAMNNSERVNFGGKQYKIGLDRIERAVDVIKKTDRQGLSDDERKAADFIQFNGATLVNSARLAARNPVLPELDRANGHSKPEPQLSAAN